MSSEPLTITMAKYVEALRSNDPSAQLFALNQLRRLSSSASANKDAIRERGAIRPTVVLLSSTAPQVRATALALVRSLSVNAKNQISIAEAGAIPHLLQCVRSDDETLQGNAAASLWNLSSEVENKAMIGDMGGVDMLLQLLQSTESVRVQGEVCGALRNLSLRYDNLQYFSSDSNGIASMIDVLTFQTEHEMRKNVAVALNMCMQHDRARQIIERHHCMHQLLRTLREFSVDLTPQTAKYLAMLEANNADGEGEGDGEGDGGVGLCNENNENNNKSSRRQQTTTRNRNRESAVGRKVVATQHYATHSTLRGNERTRHSLAAQSTLQPLSGEAFGSIAWNRLELEESIGKGSFSEVFRARYHGFVVAAKLLNDQLPDEKSKREHLLQEYHMMAAMRHPNVVLLMGTSLSPQGKPVFVSELCSRGALKDVLPDERSLLRRLKFGKDIVAGLNWLHAHNIIHRDLKCANILIDEEYTAKISDLGLALLYYDGVQCSHFKGNIKYSAPEILRARANKNIRRYAYGPQTDVYSFGLILWELVTRQPLFHGIHGSKEITMFICNGKRPPLVPGWPVSLQNMLGACWHDNPSRRPSFTTIQRDFPPVMIDALCPDPTARKICRQLWGGAETRKVAYAEFEHVFQKVTRIDLGNASLCYQRCLQQMLCDTYDHKVSFERVCNMVHVFGPMDNIQSFLNNVVTLFEQPWFFGYVRVCDAQGMLTEQWMLDKPSGEKYADGYYMIRFSDSMPGSYSLLTIGGDGTIERRRIGHQYSSEYFITIGDQEHLFPSLFALQHFCTEKLGRLCHDKRVLPGSPFQCLFAANPIQTTAVPQKQ